MFDYFFFQAEDGIRDYKVTGVQTCALPISVGLRAHRLLHALGGLQHAVRIGGLQPRSEEHTSELQSPCNLVCRLLLEKKKGSRGIPFIKPSTSTFVERTAPHHQSRTSLIST